MIRKIIKNRHEIAMAVLMISAIYGIVLINVVRGGNNERYTGAN